MGGKEVKRHRPCYVPGRTWTEGKGRGGAEGVLVAGARRRASTVVMGREQAQREWRTLALWARSIREAKVERHHATRAPTALKVALPHMLRPGGEHAVRQLARHAVGA